MAYKRSVFPENGYDTFPEVYDISPEQEALAKEYYELGEKINKTPAEEERYNYLNTVFQNNKITPEHMNKFGDAVTGMQKFFVENTQGYINGLKTDMDAAKDNALIAIENKKQNVIDYMDGITAGQLRNDIGDMSESEVEGTSLVEKTNFINEKANQNTADIQELFQSVSNSKELLAAAITDTGIKANGSDTFIELANKIGEIPIKVGTVARRYNTYELMTRFSFDPIIALRMN